MEILKLLSPNDFVSGETIAKKLSITRAAVHKKIIRLRAEGYAISGHRNRGYRLISIPDLLSPDLIRSFLPANCLMGKNILHYASIDSTQTKAKDLANNGAHEGTIVIAERQTASYGRLRRLWDAPGKGIWISLILRPALHPERVAQITLVFSIAVCRAIERLLSLAPAIKWPNDVLIGNKKAAGILTEMSAEVGRLNWVVVGLGLNANNVIPARLDDTAVSLGSLAGGTVNRPRLLAGILSEFNERYAAFCLRGFKAFEKEYTRRSCMINEKVRLEDGGRTLDGIVQKIDNNGYLRLKLDNGRSMKIIAGDVTTRR